MNLDLRPVDFVVALVIGLIGAVSAHAHPGYVQAVSDMLLFAALTMVILETRRKVMKSREIQRLLRNEIRSAFSQMEALSSLANIIKPHYIMPPTRGWAASPDFLLLLADRIMTLRPDYIVELGSGVSTLIAAYALQKNGGGRVLSFEHDPTFANAATEQLRKHNLADYANVVLAPLVRHEIGGRYYKWYDLSRANLDQPIQMLIVDGPPGNIQPWSRYPALPLLTSNLASQATLLMDDGLRADEQAIAKAWCKRHGPWQLTLHLTEKGAIELTR